MTRRPAGRGDTLDAPAGGDLPLFRAPRSPESPPLTASDHARLGAQQAAVLAFCLGRGFVSLAEIEAATGAPQASASARLRTARSMGYSVERRREGNRYLYRVTR